MTKQEVFANQKVAEYFWNSENGLAFVTRIAVSCLLFIIAWILFYAMLNELANFCKTMYNWCRYGSQTLPKPIFAHYGTIQV